MPVVLKGCRSCQEHFPKNVDACLGCGKYCYEEECKGGDVEKCIATEAFKQCDMGCLKKKIPHAFEKPANSLSGHYFSFRTGGNPGDVVDRFEARQTGDRVTCAAGWLVGRV